MRGRVRSSRTRSSSAARCASWWASGRWRTAQSRPRCAAREPTSGCRWARPPRGRSSCWMPSRRRLLGLDRSGPRPRATRRGQPLRPFTIPNLVGYGRTAAAAILYLAISAGDYLDGLLARATGQYSRMGALLDPVIDRLTVIAGLVVCWKFELLPRWALGVLGARELVTLLLAHLALRRGVELEINWVGRLSIWLTMGGIFLALAVDAWIAPAVFLVGLVGSLLASVLYVKAGVADIRHAATSTST